MKTLYHVQVVRAAFENYLTPKAMDWMIRGNFNIDFYGSLGWKLLEFKILPLYPAAQHWYKQIDHLDEYPDLDHLCNAWNELLRRVHEIADDVKYPPQNVRKMLIQLGRNSHSLTDVYSHSIYVELLYEYYKQDEQAAEQVKKSGLSLPEYIGGHAPLFSQIADSASDEYKTLVEKYIVPKLYCAVCLPDKGPRCHEAINKDAPSSTQCNNPDFPDVFKPVMELATREVVQILKKFFDDLKEKNPSKYEILTTAMPGDMAVPGPFERRAKWWSDRFGAYD